MSSAPDLTREDLELPIEDAVELAIEQVEQFSERPVDTQKVHVLEISILELEELVDTELDREETVTLLTLEIKRQLGGSLEQ